MRLKSFLILNLLNLERAVFEFFQGLHVVPIIQGHVELGEKVGLGETPLGQLRVCHPYTE